MSEATKTRKPLTARQQAVLCLVNSFIASEGYSPTLREIADGLDLDSEASVQYSLQVLAERGLLTVARGKARGISLPNGEGGPP